MKPILEIHNISKQYKLFNLETKSKEAFWALKDVSFNLEQGEAIGVLGKNGSGKSTLLKIISSITSPSHGHIIVRGSIISLLELGTGFHHDLTGRENTFVYGSMVGLKKKEIKKKFDEIVDFADIEKFIDTKVRNYSTGMLVRLAFSIATLARPDVLLADEVFAVGDHIFKKKCDQRITELKAKGTAMLIVQHDKEVLRKTCEKGVLLTKGRLTSYDEIGKVIHEFHELSAAKTSISS